MAKIMRTIRIDADLDARLRTVSAASSPRLTDIAIIEYALKKLLPELEEKAGIMPVKK